MQKKYNKDTYCHSAMHSFSLHSNGRTRPCCVSKVHTSKFMPGTDVQRYPAYSSNPDHYQVANNIEEFVNDDSLKQIRKQILNGEKPDACKECFNLEEKGIKSFRQLHNDDHIEDIDTTLENINQDGSIDIKAINYLDVTLGNVCNLKCRTCNPWASHSWLDEAPTVPHNEFTKTTYIVSKMSSQNPWFLQAFETGFFNEVLPNISTINFLGGEPLVVKEHYAWLEKIVEMGYAKNITLQYNSNGTTIPKKILDVWKSFKQIVLSLSIDAVDELAYYVRHPSKWHVIQRNVGKLAIYTRTNSNLSVQTHVTLSSLNIHALPKIIAWCGQNYKTWNHIDKSDNNNWRHHGYENFLPHFNIVERPYNMHMCHIPDNVKSDLCKMLDDLYTSLKNSSIPEWEKHSLENILNLKNIINQPRSEKEWNNFLDNTKASDKFRNVNITDYVPWIKECM